MLSNLFYQKLLWPILLLITANGLILAQAPLLLRYPAALLLLMFLPGWVWGRSLFAYRLDLTERLTLAVGLSLALTILASLVVVYLPWPVTATALLIIINGIILLGLAVGGWQHRPETPRPPTRYLIPLSLVLLLVLAATLRLPRLGYAEFHEDEAEALMLGVRLLQGEDYAIFLHRKGPAQMLLPVALWLMTGRITETLARFPFAVSSILSVAAIFFLGRRWFNWQVGLVAGSLWAINGYAVAFGRMVQYQALIFFLGPLALYCFYLAWQTGWWRWQLCGTILLAVCLLAHFDALLLLPAAAFLALIYLQGPASKATEHHILQPRLKSAGSAALPFRQRLLQVSVTLLLFLALLAAFYVPYSLDPDFGNTATYLTESRIKPGLLYNNLELLRRFDRDYSSHFYLPLLAIGLVSFVGWAFQKKSRRQTAAKRELPLLGTLPTGLTQPRIAALLLVLVATTFWWPDGWQIGLLSLAILPWLLALGLCFGLAPTYEAKAAWLLFGVPLVGYIFLIDDPRTHLYIIYPGAVLLAGVGWSSLILNTRGRELFLAIGSILVAAVVIYLSLIFLRTESSFSTLRQHWDDSAWVWIYNDLPQPREYFGYPKREGWKAIGALRAQGEFPGDFRSVNEDFIVPIWYNYGEARSCYDTPTHFFVRPAGLEAFETDGPYALVGEVSRENENRLQIFGTGDQPAAPSLYRLEDYEALFDQRASPQHYTQQAAPARPVGAQFGPAIEFVGFDLPATSLAPGDTLQLNLYWRALQPPGERYRVFVHLTDGTTLWSQQDDDPACRLPTTVWRAGQHGLGQFRLAIPPDMPPGRYPLIIGLYQVDTLERLPVTGGSGQPGDDFLWLGDVEIVAR